MPRLSKILYLLTVLILTALIPIELLSIYDTAYGTPGFVLWILLSGLLVIGCFRELYYLLFRVFRTVFTFSAVVILGFSIFLQLENNVNLNHEATQEIGCALSHYFHDNGFGFRESCLFGYPSRQFFLPMLFPLAFGRSQLALNLGGAIWLLLALPVFAAGLFRFLRTYSPRNADAIAGITLSTLPHYYYFNHFLFNYEQSIFPPAFAMLCSGFLMSFISSGDKSQLKLALASVIIATYSYTPSIALIPLSIGVLIILWRKKYIKLPVVTGYFFLLIFNLLISATFRLDGTILDPERAATEYYSDIIGSLMHLAYLSPGPYVVSSWLVVPMVIALIWSLSGRMGKEFFWIAFWITGVLAIAYLSRGYTYYHFNFRHHRALVALPLLSVVLAWVTASLSLKLKSKLFDVLIKVAFLGIMAHGLLLQRILLEQKPPQRMLTYLIWLTGQPDMNLSEGKYIFLFPSQLEHEFASFNDFLMYFSPASQSHILRDSCEPLTFSSGTILILNRFSETSDIVCPEQISNFETQRHDFSDKLILGEDLTLRVSILHLSHGGEEY
jgi:hypothetical protein